MYMFEIKKPNAIGKQKMSELQFDYDDYDYRISSKLLEIYFLILECKWEFHECFRRNGIMALEVYPLMVL